MKKLIFLIACFCLSLSGYSQWTAWQTIYEEGRAPNSTKVQISFKLSVCNNNMLRGYSFYRINNEFQREKAYVKVNFSYLQCDGKEATEHVTIPLAKKGIDDNRGKWFLGYKITSLSGAKYDDYGAKSQQKKDGTGVTGGTADEMVFDNTPKINYDRLKTTVEKKINALPNGTYKNWYRIKLDDIEKLKDSYENKTSSLQKLEQEVDDKTAENNKLKQSNTSLKETVRMNIEAVPAPDQQKAFMAEYNSALSKETNPEEFKTTMENLNSRVLNATAAINRNKEQFQENKSETESKIDTYKQEGEQIRETQATIVGGMAVLGAGLFSFKGPSGEKFRYRGSPSMKMSVIAGLNVMQQPYGAIIYTEGSIYRRSDGALIPLNEKRFDELTFLAPGLYGSGEIYPYYSPRLAIGFTGHISYNYWPSAYDDGGVVTGLSSASTGYKSVFNYALGAELAAGGKSLKLLVKVLQEERTIQASESSATTLDLPNGSSESATYHNEDQHWTNLVMMAGIRLGDNTKTGSYLDLALVRMMPQNIDGHKTDFKLKDIVKRFDKSPVGLYLSYTHKNSWFGRGTIIQKSYTLDSKTPKLYYTDDKLFFELTIGRRIDFFGKPFKKK